MNRLIIKEISDPQFSTLKKMCEKLFTQSEYIFIDTKTCQLRFILSGKMITFHWFELCIVDIPLALFGNDYFNESTRILSEYYNYQVHPVDSLYQTCIERDLV